jgi:hypothetical protein
MANVTADDRTDLAKRILQYLKDQGEEAPKLLVDTLTAVSVGYFLESLGYGLPVSKDTEHKEMAGHLVATYLRGTRPSPLNNYLVMLQQSGASYLQQKNPPPPPVSADVVTILATLAMGYTRETDPKPTKMAATAKFIDLYVDGR